MTINKWSFKSRTVEVHLLLANGQSGMQVADVLKHSLKTKDLKKSWSAYITWTIPPQPLRQSRSTDDNRAWDITSNSSSGSCQKRKVTFTSCNNSKMLLLSGMQTYNLHWRKQFFQQSQRRGLDIFTGLSLKTLTRSALYIDSQAPYSDSDAVPDTTKSLENCL